MRKSNWTRSIVPKDEDQTVYLVLDDLGQNGVVWPEAEGEMTDLETVTRDLLEGQYRNPIRVVGFNTAEGWSQDVSADIAHDLRHRCDLQMRDIPFHLQDFVDRYEGRYHDSQLPLPIRLV
jgi:hypothetical protein